MDNATNRSISIGLTAVYQILISGFGTFAGIVFVLTERKLEDSVLLSLGALAGFVGALLLTTIIFTMAQSWFFTNAGEDLFLVEWAVDADVLGYLLGPAQFAMYALVTTLGLIIPGPWSAYVPATWGLISLVFWTWVVIRAEWRRGWTSYDERHE